MVVYFCRTHLGADLVIYVFAYILLGECFLSLKLHTQMHAFTKTLIKKFSHVLRLCRLALSMSVRHGTRLPRSVSLTDFVCFLRRYPSLVSKGSSESLNSKLFFGHVYGWSCLIYSHLETHKSESISGDALTFFYLPWVLKSYSQDCDGAKGLCNYNYMLYIWIHVYYSWNRA